MSERRSDFELLRDFVRRKDQSAFTDVVRRHIDLVYATALRKLEDHGAAEEVAQNVFETLARKAWQFAADDSLAAWLYRTTLLEAKEWLRGELRRRRRELTAAELGTTMKTPDEQTTFRALLPMLDEALMSLRDKDRTALLLRFYESQSLRDVGASLGVSEDTAQKRVSGALEKISRFFQQRGFRTATVATATAALQHTVIAAPAATTAMIASAACKCASASFGLSLIARVASLSKTQIVAVSLAIALVPLAWQTQQVHAINNNIAAVEQQLAAARTQHEQASAELQRLRTEAARLGSTTIVRGVEAARKLEDLRARLRVEDYRWHDDLPFAWIPKSLLPKIGPQNGQWPVKNLQTKVQDVLNLKSRDQQAVDRVFASYFDAADRLVDANVYETNQARRLQLPAGAESTVFVFLPADSGISNLVNELYSNLAVTLGPERWALLNPNESQMAQGEVQRLEGFFAPEQNQPREAAVNIFVKEGTEPMVTFTGEYGIKSEAMPLKLFRSAASSQESMAGDGRLANDSLFQVIFPKPVEARVQQWLANEAATRLPNDP